MQFILKDVLRPDAAATLEKFERDKVSSILLSGDREAWLKISQL